MNSLAVYPGSFDPITNGHLDIIARAANVFDRVIVAVLANPRKAALLDVETRIGVIRATLDAIDTPRDRVQVEAFDGLTVELCRTRGASAIVRGLRAISDFETELQLAHNNRVLAPEVDTVFFMTSVANGYVSSSLVREIASFGGDVSTMIPPAAVHALDRVVKDAEGPLRVP
jgi:pantetheine-phosphate adenylyltransferase